MIRNLSLWTAAATAMEAVPPGEAKNDFTAAGVEPEQMGKAQASTYRFQHYKRLGSQRFGFPNRYTTARRILKCAWRSLHRTLHSPKTRVRYVHPIRFKRFPSEFGGPAGS